MLNDNKGLATVFSDGASALETAHTSLNYAWINKQPVNTKEAYALCGVPLNYLDTAIANARRYPDALVNVWVDEKLLDTPSRFFVGSYAYLAETENLKIRNLHEIPEYATDDFFDAAKDTPIWSRVNYARLLVVAHEIKTKGVQYAFYSDFDVRDARINDREMTSMLDQFGVVVGSTRELAIENGYFGFGEKGRKLLCEQLVPATRRNVRDEGVHCGYAAYTMELDKWFVNDPAYAEKISVPILKSMGYKIPFNPEHDGLGLYSP